jgi:hypothetical protein
MKPDWLIYEEAARKVIADMRDALGISVVEGKQVITGLSSAEWEIDARAWCKDGENFLLVEARRHNTSGLKQEALAAIAYRIKDVGAAGGIVVSPLPLQTGAQTIAAHEGVSHIHLTPESTSETYLAEFLGRRFIGASVVESVTATDSSDAVVSRGAKNDA